MNTRKLHDFDFYMVLTAGFLIGFGVVAIWSAQGGGQLSILNEGVRQAIFAIIGVMLLVFVASFNYRFLGTFAWVFYAGSLASLVLVLVPGIGMSIAGSRRWFNLGVTTVQPSEFAKLATIIALASFVASRGEQMHEFGNFAVSLLIALVPAGLVFLQPDLGSSTVFGVIWFSIIVTTRVRWRYLGPLLLAIIPVAYAGWHFLMRDYQKVRLLISFDPFKDPTGDGYNVIQARYAIGAGGIFGSGLQGGTQSRLELLKVRESDFIFAHASGMVGFVGIICLFVLYAILLWRCLRVAQSARDQFGQALAIGFSAMLFYQTFVNIGMNMGIMPVTGITLPLISQGASSLWTFLIGIGVLQSVLLHHRKLAFQAP
ncbi:MAG: rod shape-determining protein RodA [Thermomicrobiales bacterium]|nr:rod shape-determining protein RodA [Thermomicrobiales bacterium]